MHSRAPTFDGSPRRTAWTAPFALVCAALVVATAVGAAPFRPPLAIETSSGATAPTAPAPHRTRAVASAAKSLAAWSDLDLTADAAGSVSSSDAHQFSPDLMRRVRALTDPRFLRGDRTVAATVPRLPGAPRDADKDLPWSPDALLANPTDMDDEYISLAASELSGDLYAVFAAVDLGGTDRDIHIARSQDDGATWDVWEMPSFGEDEYHPTLAVDGGGYLHVAWVRADGYILRSRTTGPDDPTQWAWVKGLQVGEPCATPSIAVSGAGDFAKVFIAAGWLTVNTDYLAYEWTLLFMNSSNGGQSVVYDYFLPDGYADYWPSVTMSGGTVHFVNAEVDAFTGETEILIASDLYTGGFSSPASFTGWTSNNTGFPRVTGQGDDVFVVYQLDYADGLTTDGDIIYSYSWDGGATFYGPYGMVADEYDSVGPAVFTRDGAVGCVWLDAPAGADEYRLASRLGSGRGDIGSFGDVEMVSEDPRVEPVFHSAAGVLTDAVAHAAWIDRRDFPTQGHNVYTSRRALQADLRPFTPADWDSSLIVNMFRGDRTDGWIAAGDTAWVSFAFANDGLRDAGQALQVDLRLDGVTVASWELPAGLEKGTYVPLEDHPLVAGAGLHEVSVVLDATGVVDEDDESNNTIARTYRFIDGDPAARVRPTRLVTIVDPDLGAAEAFAIAADPPLRREVHVQVVDPRLEAACAAQKSSARHPVVVVPAERLDAPALAFALQGAAPTTLRAAVIEAARNQTTRSRDQLQPALDSLGREGQIGPVRELWLSGMLSTELTAAGVAELAAHPDVGRIWLDDRACETFGRPSTASADKAAASHLDLIGAPDAWASGHTGEGVLVGHLDTGAAYDHPDLANRLWDGGATYPHHGWDAVDEDADPYDGDSDWYHGTHTAGLIVGDGTAGTAVGSAPGAELMILRVVPGYYSDVVEGLQFGLDNGVHLFNMSAGWTLPPPDVRVANRYNAELLASIDVPWICAAGNGDNTGGHNPVPTNIASPGDSPNPWYAPNGGATSVITVGAVADAVTVSPLSSYGPTEWDLDNTYGDTDYHDYPWPGGLMKPDVAAPGVAVVSLSGQGGYVAYDGTSMACPLVTGACAVLLSAQPGLTPAQLAETLETTALDLTAAPASPGRDPYSGAGLIDMAAALGQAPGGGGGGGDLDFVLTNEGELPLVIDQVFTSAGWLTVTAPTAPLAPGASIALRAAVDPSRLVEGLHRGTIFYFGNDPASPLMIPVDLLYGDFATDVDDTPATPAADRLRNHPNPFNPRTEIVFANPRRGAVRLDIYDLKGRLVRSLLDGPRPAGRQTVMWDGRDTDGRELASGTYLARLRDAAGAEASRKLTLIR